MAIAIEGYTVVGLKSRLEEKLEGGVGELSRQVPNATEVADDDLWRCAFMVEADAQRFLEKLQSAGLNTSQGPDPDLVLASEADLSISPYCEWLQIVQWKKGVIAWLTGTLPKTVVAREGWSPEEGSGLQFGSRENDPNLEFRRLEDNIAVYFDKRLGREVFVARLEPDPDEVFKAAAKTIVDYNVQIGQPPVLPEDRPEVAKAVAQLTELAQKHPNAWRVHFILGKGEVALGNVEQAYQSWKRAYELEKENESILRELAGACLFLGRADEAIQAGERAAALHPDDYQTLGNLACAYLIGGRLDQALTTIRAARKLEADDSTNKNLERAIERVRAGEMRQPRNLRDFGEKPSTAVASTVPRPQAAPAQTGHEPLEPERSNPSFWDRLKFWKRTR